MEPVHTEAFGVYVHWPFCRAKCPYCDFNSHVRHAPVDAMGFADALSKELAAFAELAPGRRVASVFFGGGTPSLMPPAAVARVLQSVDRLWGLPGEAEVTLEANPTSAEAANFRGYRAAGVNRASVGVQSLVDADLVRLGRQHTAAEALAAFRAAASIFERVSFDMIYARPGQTLAQWKDELSRAIAEQRGHMSLYQLTIEPNTRFFDLASAGSLVVPSDDRAAELFELTQDMTAAAGLDAYEVSNHARAGHESRHNLIYWRYGEYAGAGPGAHARIAGEHGRRLAIRNEPHPETWRSMVQERGNGRVEMTALDESEMAAELLLMGLRLTEGIDLARYDMLSRLPLHAQVLRQLRDDGLIRLDEDRSRLSATPQGRRVLNSLTAALASGRVA